VTGVSVGRGAVLLLAFALLAAGCGQRSAGGTSSRARSPAVQGVMTAAQRRVLAAAYLKIASAGNRRLEVDFNRLNGRDHGHRAAAEADLRDAAATERLFDRRLLQLKFPQATELIARFLTWANQSRAQLTATAARSASRRQLARYRRQLDGASVPVEQAVGIIRARLGLPPPAAS
jgi:hypothetical protein